MDNPAINEVYEIIGEEPIIQLVRLFYSKVDQDSILRPLYRDNLSIPALHLQQYLIQHFGGPSVYEQNRGKPKLKFRHVPFPIGHKERDQWMKLMSLALSESEFSDYPDIKQSVHDFFDRLSTRLINNKKFIIEGRSK